ncbi:MAG TPA: histidine--tRNA ligase [Candidatus Xenobia bacterium]|nr:histidine--tRNA ligase [Candidatus Xenobia bacterium]
MKRKFQAVKGTRDILPPESALWNRVEHTARQVFAAYNFHEIRPPIFEEYEVFARSVGLDTDIVSKEMYTFPDKAPGRIEALRSWLATEQIDFRDIQRIRTFIGWLAEFLQNVKAAYKEGEIPNTDQNRTTIDALDTEYTVVARQFGQDPPVHTEIGWNQFRFRVGVFAHQVMLASILALRPEATASVCRAYIEHGMHTWPSPVKLYYIGPMFRRERPQKGRFRQFYQIGAEVLGPSDHPAIDAEVIELVMVFLERCGLRGVTLYVNSIGCSECRPKYVLLLTRELINVQERLSQDSRSRIGTNPLRVLDSKLEKEQPIIAKLPSILDHLCDACRDHFAKVQQELTERGIQYEINWRLVRGLDYYMRTTFEITAPGLGAQNAVCGGGRYDGLVELLGGPPTKGIGWALGTDRLVLALQQSQAGKAAPSLDAFLVWLGEAAYKRARQLARTLRDAGARVEIPYEEMRIKKALGRADQLKARYAVIIGENELQAGTFTLRDMTTGAQRSISDAEMVKELSGTTDAHR